MKVETLIKILSEAAADRARLVPTIAEFQRVMWGDEAEGPENILEVLRDLAIDLDYYEPNPAWRAEDPSFVDDDEAVKRIREALSKVMVS